MTARTPIHGLQVDTQLHRFIEDEVLPDTGVASEKFWKGFDAIVADLAPKNLALLADRDRLQSELDRWHKANPGPIRDMAAYRAFLEKIGYLVPPPADVRCTTTNVDAELALQAGPQLVVPILNARYALNAANARWGSLYDALYGTDVIPHEEGLEAGMGYNPARGAKVIEYARQFLDQAAPLAAGSHADAVAYRVEGGKLKVELKDGSSTGLKNSGEFIGYRGETSAPSSVLLRNNGIHIDIQIDRSTSIGSTDAAGISDVVLEAALSTILDLEDSVAVVDAQDKVLAYRNWLGILKGTLTEQVTKGGKTFTRGLNGDRSYTAPDGTPVQAAWPLAAVHPQRRPPDDQSGHPVWRRQGDSRRHPGCGDHHADRVARSAGPRRPRHPQLAHRLGLHRQAQDARPAGSRLRLRAVRPRSRACWACRPTPSSWASWTRNAAPASTCRPASPRRPRGWRSSTPGSWTAPATRCTPRCTPVRCCARAP